MKNNTISAIAITFLIILLGFTTAPAADQVKIFEMGESGITVEFPMTPEEISAEDAANKVLRATGRLNVTKPKNRAKVFEMGEGGHRVEFPMTAAEITAANAENARLAAIKAVNALELNNRAEVFEMAESGLNIEFPVAVTETEVSDSAIAGSTFENEDLSI